MAILFSSLVISQLLQQRLGVLQIGGVEALGEPVVDLGEHRTRIVKAIRIAQQSRKARCRAQFKHLRAHVARQSDSFAKVCFRRLYLLLLKPKFTSQSVGFRPHPQFFGIGRQSLINRRESIGYRAREVLSMSERLVISDFYVASDLYQAIHAILDELDSFLDLSQSRPRPT